METLFWARSNPEEATGEGVRRTQMKQTFLTSAGLTSAPL